MNHDKKKLTTLLLIVICAALSFGGSFTCKGEQNSDRFTQAVTVGGSFR